MPSCRHKISKQQRQSVYAITQKVWPLVVRLYALFVMVVAAKPNASWAVTPTSISTMTIWFWINIQAHYNHRQCLNMFKPHGPHGALYQHVWRVNGCQSMHKETCSWHFPERAQAINTIWRCSNFPLDRGRRLQQYQWANHLWISWSNPLLRNMASFRLDLPVTCAELLHMQVASFHAESHDAFATFSSIFWTDQPYNQIQFSQFNIQSFS